MAFSTNSFNSKIDFKFNPKTFPNDPIAKEGLPLVEFETIQWKR